MSNAPNDLKSLRLDVMDEVGFTNPVEVGIVADQSHLEGGGYHCGCGDINSIGKYNNTDPSDRDYSVRQSRDRIGSGTNVASAMDIGDDWPRGGRAGWLRFGWMLRAQLGARDGALTALRAINYLNSAGQKRRFDTLTMTETSSNDSVDIHTHIEWWRNTEGTATRAASISRLLDIVRAARDNVALDKVDSPSSNTIGAEMIYTLSAVPAGAVDMNGAGIVNNSRVVATPRGVFSLNGGEAGSVPGTYWTNVPTMTLARMQALCAAMAPAQTPVDVAALAATLAGPLAAAVSEQLPGGVEITPEAMVAALTNPTVAAALVEDARQGANLAEDS